MSVRFRIGELQSSPAAQSPGAGTPGAARPATRPRLPPTPFEPTTSVLTRSARKLRQDSRFDAALAELTRACPVRAPNSPKNDKVGELIDTLLIASANRIVEDYRHHEAQMDPNLEILDDLNESVILWDEAFSRAKEIMLLEISVAEKLN